MLIEFVSRSSPQVESPYYQIVLYTMNGLEGKWDWDKLKAALHKSKVNMSEREVSIAVGVAISQIVRDGFLSAELLPGAKSMFN